jgi:hypothetical protein
MSHADDPHEIQFNASDYTPALVAAGQMTPIHRTDRFTWIAEARAFAVQVSLDTIRPVLQELIDGPEGKLECFSDLRASVTTAGDPRKRAVVFHDPRGDHSMAVGFDIRGRMSVVCFGADGITAEQAVAAVHDPSLRVPRIEPLPKIGGMVILSSTSPGSQDDAVWAASALAGYLKEIRPAAVETAIVAAKSGKRHAYVTPEPANAFIRATAAALAVDGFIVWGCVGATLDILWADVLTAEFVARAEKADQLAAAILAKEGTGHRDEEASWAEETPDGASLVLLARDDVGVRIETRGDTLTATLVDYESGSPVESIAVVEKVLSDQPVTRSNSAYSAKLATLLGNFAFLYLDDHYESLCINKKRATSPSP